MQHQSQTKTCQNCKKDFIIEPDDFLFYEKIKVPPPTFCPDCRQQRRYSWRNERTLYRRNCDLCRKSTVTIYNPESLYKVYCSKCWWGDGWDGKELGRDFDFSRPFFEQWGELQLKVPRLALLNKNSINSDYMNHGHDSKNCYLCIATIFSENILYSNAILHSKDSLECYRMEDNNSFMYWSINAYRSFNCQFCFMIQDCMDCLYCVDCKNCSDCFLSSNLRNKKYVFNNEQLSKDDYLEKIKNFNLKNYTDRLDLYNLYLDLLKSNTIYRYAITERVVNSTGNLLFDSKNCRNCFETSKGEDSKNIYIADMIKDCFDSYHVGGKAVTLCYEGHALSGASNIFFCHLSYDNTFVEYCDSVHNSNNLFGCVGLKKANYCILNKQYTKEEYTELKEKIIEHMKKTGEYGEFFPVSLSPFGYNETQGQVYMPLTKEEAISKGFKWQDNILMIKGKETIQPEDLPDSIDDIKDNITDEILKCIKCERNYNIVNQELELYRRMNIPIPRECPNCRCLARIALRPARKLWHRSCMKEGCTNEFETSYAPDRPEIIYCEKCYQQEVY